MLELIELYLPQIVAGLFPSLIAVIPVIITSIKNIKVNKQVEELQNIVADLASGRATLNSSVDKAGALINDAVGEVTDKLDVVYKTAKDAIEQDAKAISVDVRQTVKSAEATMSAFGLQMQQLMEEVIRRGYVPEVRQEGQEEVPVSKD